MQFFWHEPKRQANLKKHGMDFVDAEHVFTGPLFTIVYFKAKAGERGCQTLINETLRQVKEHEELEHTLWRVIREELHHEKRCGST